MLVRRHEPRRLAGRDRRAARPSLVRGGAIPSGIQNQADRGASVVRRLHRRGDRAPPGPRRGQPARRQLSRRRDVLPSIRQGSCDIASRVSGSTALDIDPECQRGYSFAPDCLSRPTTALPRAPAQSFSANPAAEICHEYLALDVYCRGTRRRRSGDPARCAGGRASALCPQPGQRRQGRWLQTPRGRDRALQGIGCRAGRQPHATVPPAGDQIRTGVRSRKCGRSRLSAA